jgi:hypothetical protein
VLPCPYNVTFKKEATNPVGLAILTEQIEGQSLNAFTSVIGLGSKEYRAAVEQAFAPYGPIPVSRRVCQRHGVRQRSCVGVTSPTSA